MCKSLYSLLSQLRFLNNGRKKIVFRKKLPYRSFDNLISGSVSKVVDIFSAAFSYLSLRREQRKSCIKFYISVAVLSNRI